MQVRYSENYIEQSDPQTDTALVNRTGNVLCQDGDGKLSILWHDTWKVEHIPAYDVELIK